ncbi:MAG: hypothetical protein JXB25_03140 [Deltaproteobacteria bacterium]|nr:hypothetical protein [Deltaproteobacteria bacterium]
MKGVTFFVALLFVVVSSVAFAAPAPQKVVDLGKGKLAELGKDKVIVKAVRADNAEGLTLDQIKKMDEEWIAAKKAKQTIPLMKEKLENACAKYLKETIMPAHPYITEIFVCNKMGANVCQTDLTGDYWQGDEAKHKDVFKKDVLVSEVEQEDGKNIAQVSVPVMMGKMHVGTMTIGVDVDKVP